MKLNRYIVRTYVDAGSITEALKKAKSTPPHEIYLDDRVSPTVAPQEKTNIKIGFKTK